MEVLAQPTTGLRLPTEADMDNNNISTNNMYKVVAVAVDLTGKKAVDEICQIAGYTVNEKSPQTFSQYIMPYRNIGRNGTRYTGLRIFTNFGYRVLKDLQTMKSIRTKSEFAALNDFVGWLKKVKGNCRGVILVHHGNVVDNMMPFLMEALERYKMTEEFFDVVCGTINCRTRAAELPELKKSACSMRSLLKHVLKYDDKEVGVDMLQSAKTRAELTYKILGNILNKSDEVPDMAPAILDKCATKEEELKILEDARVLTQKIKSLRPIFAKRLREGIKQRTQAVNLRQYLVELEVDYETVKDEFNKGSKDAIVKMLEKTSAEKKKAHFDQLVDLIVSHFEEL